MQNIQIAQKIENPSDSYKPEGKSKHFATFTPNENTKT
jgi:hypothetical protein